jgi:vitamin B12 transporter
MRHSLLLGSLLRVSCSALNFLAIALIAPVQAQVPSAVPSPESDEDEVIIRSILEQPVSGPTRSDSTVQDLTRPTYVVTQEQIQERGARTVQEALRYLPGILSDGTAGGQLGAQSSQFIRGASSSQVLILLDGRPISDKGSGGGFDLSSFTTTNIERIEVIPGGGSALYGSDAIGGIINIVSKRPTSKTETEISINLGSFGYNQATISSGGKSGNVGWMASYGRTQSGNNFPYRIRSARVEGVTTKLDIKGERSNASALYNNADLRLEYDINPRNNLALGLTYQTKDLDVPGGVKIPVDNSAAERASLTEQANQYSRQLFADLIWTSKLGKSDNSKLITRLYGDNLYDQYNQPENQPDIDLYAFRSQSKRQSIGAQIQHNWQFKKDQALTYGIDYRNTKGRNETFDDLSNTSQVSYDDKVQEGAVFASYKVQLGDLQLNVGLRKDFSSLVEGGALSPSAGLKFDLGSSTTIRANISRSFRTPLISDTLGFGGPYSLPNPGLKPERGTNIDIGIDQKFGRIGLLRLTYFDNNVSDLIAYDSTAFRSENIGRVRSRGLETALNLQLGKRWSTFVNYTINDPTIEEDRNASAIGNELAFRAADSVNAGVTYATPQGISASLLMRHLSKFYANKANTEEMPGYTTVDFKLKAALDANLTLNFQANNLFDKQYQIYPGYPSLGRNFQAGVSYRF